MLESGETSKNHTERSGSQSEPLRVGSGCVLAMDQYMLGNSQFIEHLARCAKGEGGQSSADSENLVRNFGGELFQLKAGTWKVHRFPRERVFVVCPESLHDDAVPALVDEALANSKHRGEDKGAKAPLWIETRCLVFIDWTVIQQPGVAEGYRELRSNGRDKEARDYLRQKGAAVRYGFSQDSDHLRSFTVEPEGALVLLASPE